MAEPKTSGAKIAPLSSAKYENMDLAELLNISMQQLPKFFELQPKKQGGKEMTTMRGFTEEQSNLYDAIKTVWKQKGWEWDTSVGAAAKRLAPIICSIITKELSEFQALIEETRKVVDAREKEMFASDRAKDAVALCKELKRAGLSEDNISYNVYAFLAGDSVTTPKVKNVYNDNANANENVCIAHSPNQRNYKIRL